MKDRSELRREMLMRANALYEAKEYARAAETAAELLAVLPEDAEMRYIRAAALTELERYDEARAEIARLRTIRPDHAGAARQEVYIDRAEGKFCTAIRHLRTLIAALEQKIAAGDNIAYHAVFLASAYSLLGEALTLTGESAAAVDAFRASSRLETTREKKAIEYSNALFAANYLPAGLRSDAAELARERAHSMPMCARSRARRTLHAGMSASASATSRPTCAHIPSGRSCGRSFFSMTARAFPFAAT